MKKLKGVRIYFMKESYILAIDQGTTNTKALLVDNFGLIRTSATCRLSIKYPKPGWVEQDPLDIWYSVKKVINDCLLKLNKPKIEAIAITNQRESIILWERQTGLPVGPCIVWQCRRTEGFCNKLRESKTEKIIQERTGLIIDPIFSSSKARWLIDHAKNGYRRAEQGELCLGTVDSWILFNLTGGKVHSCDISNASRTQLFNINNLKWDKELLEIFGIPGIVLPVVKQSSDLYGVSISLGNLASDVPIASIIGDSHAALFSHGCFKPGAIKVTYGTGASLMTPIYKPIKSNHGLSTTIAWMLRGNVLYAFEGVIPVAGVAIQWLCRILNLEDISNIDNLAASIKDSGGVYFVPAFVGLGAPHWKAYAKGIITGLLANTTQSHLARATLESIAYQVRDIYDVMKKESGYDLENIFADGGPSNSDFLMQFQADIIDCLLFRSTENDMSALGAAYLAGLEIDWWSSEEEIKQLPRKSDYFKPKISAKKREKLYSGWVKAVKRCVIYFD